MDKFQLGILLFQTVTAFATAAIAYATWTNRQHTRDLLEEARRNSQSSLGLWEEAKGQTETMTKSFRLTLYITMVDWLIKRLPEIGGKMYRDIMKALEAEYPDEIVSLPEPLLEVMRKQGGYTPER
jgi:hypothetical protein